MILLRIFVKVPNKFDFSFIFQVSSSPIDPPQIKYGYHSSQAEKNTWTWMDVSSPFLKYSEKVASTLLRTIHFFPHIMSIQILCSFTISLKFCYWTGPICAVGAHIQNSEDSSKKSFF